MSGRAPAVGPSPDAALALWLGAAPAVVAAERVAAEAAVGRVLAGAVQALRPSPPVTCAAMDGIAVRAAATAGAPCTLPAGAFVRVDTGEPLPPGLDAVVMRELLTWSDDGSCEVAEAVAAGRHVRPAGEDVAAGDAVLASGALVDAGALAVLLAAGVGEVEVRRRPRLAILPTGDEVRPLASARPGDVVDSNGPMVAALARAVGVDATLLAPVGDDPAALAGALSEAAAASDLVAVIAGTSRGGRDRMPEVLGELGRIDVERLAVRPGSPTLLGHVGDVPVACLPGYPVAAWVVAHLDLLPALALLGARPLPPRLTGLLAADVDVRVDQTTVHPAAASVDGDGVLRVEPLPRRASRLSVLARANALAVLPPGAPATAGARVAVQPSAGGALA